MLEAHQRRWRGGREKGENLISGGLVLYTVHAQ